MAYLKGTEMRSDSYICLAVEDRCHFYRGDNESKSVELFALGALRTWLLARHPLLGAAWEIDAACLPDLSPLQGMQGSQFRGSRVVLLVLRQF